MNDTTTTPRTDAAYPPKDGFVHSVLRSTWCRVHSADEAFQELQLGVVATGHARQLERELNEALEALQWIADRYDDSKPNYAAALDAYEMSNTARAILAKHNQ